MRVVVGPVDATSAERWIEYAREVLADPPAELAALDPDLVTTFHRYLDEWSAAAIAEEFRWEKDLPVEQVEYHLHAFHRVAEVLSARAAGRSPNSPPESEAFYRALVEGVLSALEEEHQACAEFARHLREFWPGAIASNV